ncbi:MAG TPA: hypothetical protein VFA70_08240 [Dehalococcoidia bacterium]|nr:hypothetical protein [Dehalococcoidia bacterium]
MPVARSEPGAHGVPVDLYRPSADGPPIGEAQDAGTPPDGDEGETIRLRGYRPVVPPSPARQRGGCGCGAAVAVAVALVLMLCIGALWLYQAAAHGGGARETPRATATATATATPRGCVLPVIDAAAAKALTGMQLATRVQNVAQRDFRPLDSVQILAAGQQGHLTFQVATAERGLAAVTFCTPGGVYTGNLAIPTGSRGLYAEFPADFATRDAGPCVATLSWDGAVAGVLVFTVTK